MYQADLSDARLAAAAKLFEERYSGSLFDLHSLGIQVCLCASANESSLSRIELFLALDKPSIKVLLVAHCRVVDTKHQNPR